MCTAVLIGWDPAIPPPPTHVGSYTTALLGQPRLTTILCGPLLKGTVSRDFLLLVFFMNQFPPSSRVFHLDRFKFFRKFAEIFASQGAPPVSTTPVAKLPPVPTTPVANLPPVSATPVANFSTIFASFFDTGGKFAAGVNDTGGKLPPVSTTPAANLPPVSLTPVANNGNNIRLQTA